MCLQWSLLLKNNVTRNLQLLKIGFRRDHYTKDTMLRFRRVVGMAVAATLLLTNVVATYAVEKSLWEERRAAVTRSPRFARLLPTTPGLLSRENKFFGGGSTTSQPPSNFKDLALSFDVASAVLPFGAIGAVHVGRRGAPVVFLLQDVHGNEGAQRNIGGLLNALAARGVAFVGLEGAWGPIDLEAYSRHPSPPSVSLVAEALRVSGYLSGAEWAGLTASNPLTLVGVETPTLYQANVAAAKECVSRRPAVDEFLRALTSNLEIKKTELYSEPLKSFDSHRGAYWDGRESLGNFARHLAGFPGVNKKPVPQVRRFLKAIEWENRLDFEKIETDRGNLMARLSRELHSKELDLLLSRAVEYRAGKTINGDFFETLRTLCARKDIALASYPIFSDYISFVGFVQGIHRAELLDELMAWEVDVGSHLAQSDEEKTLLEIDRDVSLLRQLLENEMSPESWAMYGKRKSSIVSLPARLVLYFDFQEPAGGLASFIRPHEDFCRLAMERDGALVKNFVSHVPFEKGNPSVLVTGGFHTPGIQSELHKKGFSTVTVTPRLEKVEGKPLDVFARDPLPFDQLFAGKPISLPSELLLNDADQSKRLVGGPSSAVAMVGLLPGEWEGDLNAWLEDQGFEVDSMSRDGDGLVRLEVVFQGTSIGFLVGRRGLIDATDKGKAFDKKQILSLPNGDSVLVYVNAPPENVASFVSVLWAPWELRVRSTFLLVRQTFLNGGSIFAPSGLGSLTEMNHGMRRLLSILIPIHWLRGMNMIPDGYSWDSPRSDGGEIPLLLGIADLVRGIAKSEDHSVHRPGLSKESARVQVSPLGLTVQLTLFDPSGQEVGRAIVDGKRGEVVLHQVVIKPGKNTFSEDLLRGVAKEFLVMKGQGILFLGGVTDPRVKQAAQRLFDQNTLSVAPKMFGRNTSHVQWPDAVDVASPEFSSLMVGSDPTDIRGSFSLSARKEFWPIEDLPAVESKEGRGRDPKVEFFPTRDRMRIREYAHLGVRDNDLRDLHDVHINGNQVGTVIFSKTPKGVSLRDILVFPNWRGQGVGKAIYAALAKQASLSLHPFRNEMGDPISFEGRNLANPGSYAIRSGLFVSGTMEIVPVGTRSSDENFEPIEGWENPVKEGTREFDHLVGEENIDVKGLNRGKYSIHFNMRGVTLPEIVGAAERDLLLEQRIRFAEQKTVERLFNRLEENSFTIVNDEIGKTLLMLGDGGVELARARFFGKRGEMTIAHTEIHSGGKVTALRLLMEIGRIGLFEGGVGRLLIRDTGDRGVVEAAKTLFEPESLRVAPHRFDRSVTNSRWGDRVDPFSEETIDRVLGTPHQTVDVSGSLSMKVCEILWPPMDSLQEKEGVRLVDSPVVEIVEARNPRDPDEFLVFSGREVVGKMSVEVNTDVVLQKKIQINHSPVQNRGRGYGSAALLSSAKLAARILFPKTNDHGGAVPLEFRNVLNPWVFEHAKKNIFIPGTLEILEAGTVWPLYDLPLSLGWGNALNERDPRFDVLTTQNFNDDGEYKVRFHLRGELQPEIVELARGDWTRTNSFLGLGIGFTFEPILLSFLGMGYLIAMVYKDKILDWLAKNNVPPWVRRGVNSYVPDLSHVRIKFFRMIFHQGQRRPNAMAPRIDHDLSKEERHALWESLMSLSPHPFEGMPPLMEINLGTLGGMEVPSSWAPDSFASDESLALMVRAASKSKAEVHQRIAYNATSFNEERGEETAAQAGAHAALYDEVKFPWATPMDWKFTQRLVTMIFQNGGNRRSRLAAFQLAYNSVRAAVWRGRLIGGTLASTNGLVLNLSPLFDPDSGKVVSEVAATLLNLGMALNSESPSGEFPIELLVDFPLEKGRVEARIKDFIPDYAKFEKSGRLRVRVRGVDKDVFKDGRISLMGLHEGFSLTAVGISEDHLLTDEIQPLKARGITFVPWHSILSKKVEDALKKMVFIRISA